MAEDKHLNLAMQQQVKWGEIMETHSPAEGLRPCILVNNFNNQSSSSMVETLREGIEAMSVEESAPVQSQLVDTNAAPHFVGVPLNFRNRQVSLDLLQAPVSENKSDEVKHEQFFGSERLVSSTKRLRGKNGGAKPAQQGRSTKGRAGIRRVSITKRCTLRGKAVTCTSLDRIIKDSGSAYSTRGGRPSTRCSNGNRIYHCTIQ